MDFMKCQTVWKAYGGSLPKSAIIYHDALYMVKSPRTVTNRSINSNRYINQIYAEHLCCSIIASMGYDVQETMLGTYGSTIAVACKDFTQETYTLKNFIQIKNSVSACKYSSKSVDLDDILFALSHQTYIDPNALETYFWDQFILDAFFGNEDRYNENWGILQHIDTNEYQLAPIYDCASSMDFDLEESEMIALLSDKNKCKAYILNANSVICKQGKPINYSSFLFSCPYESCNIALSKFLKRID